MEKRQRNPKPGSAARAARKLTRTTATSSTPITIPIKRRSSVEIDRPRYLYLGNVHVDEAGRQLIGPSGAVKLTRIEWEIVQYLLENSGRVLTREQILSRVWGPAYRDATSLLHDAICRLRHCFEAAGANAHTLETRHGIGYRLRPPEELIATAE